MFYKSELVFLQDTLKRYRIQSAIINPSKPLDERFDSGFEKLFTDGNSSFYNIFNNIKPNTIYNLTDMFGCYYIFLMLPETREENVLIIGPYTKNSLTHQQILEKSENLGFSPNQATQLEKFYSNVPIILDDSFIFALLDTLGEVIWGSSKNFSVTDIEQEYSVAFSPIPEKKDQSETDADWNIELLEKRYEYENEIMEAVSRGQTHKADIFLSGFSTLPFEQRASDPIRNLKNYCIIMNTLLRKAAQSGGVHPVYLDKTSSSFARKIELVSSTDVVYELMQEMFRSYCRLVKKHSTKNYSSPVQKAIVYIDTNLSSDLSLHTLAGMQNISSSYLSFIFKQETGQTLTDYVNSKRVKSAMSLLKNTRLQIQTVAQHCGFLDVHYFSRVFKKYTDKTPKEYRESL